MHKHCDKYWGCCAIQEQMMEILMDCAHFTLGEANAARKVVAKKQMSKIPELKKQVYDKVNNDTAADYIWEVAVSPQLGYAFSVNHSLPYSFVGLQSIYLAINFNPIYWNTACLIINSGSLSVEEENDDEDKKSVSTDYGKIAKAIGDIQSAGITVSLADINKSKFGFSPDVENNRILFGLKGILNVGDDIVDAIIKNRPFSSPKDFLQRVKPNKQAMVALIKSGIFDTMEDRKFVMAWYLWETCDKKNRITLQNMGGLIKHNLLPEKNENQIMARRIYEFTRYLKAITKADTASYKDRYTLDERAINFLQEIHCDSLIETDNLGWFMKTKLWENIYQKYMDIFRTWIAEEKDTILNALNEKIFLEDWEKYAKGNISAWEMEVLCFYYHEHELTNVNNNLYGFADFSKLPEEPVVEVTKKIKGKDVNIFKLNKICGTCIAKDKNKAIVTVLTTTGVVNIKFRKEYFSMFDKRISERGVDGVKHIIEKSWFDRGSIIVVTGIRSGDNFISKKYASTNGHQLYKVENINSNGTLTLRNTRYQGEEEEDV
jgi:DNA polymerase-3 subunit alpha